MKKKYLFLLPVLAMLLAGCNKSNASPESKEEETSISESASTSQSTSSQTSSGGDTSSQDTSSGDASSEETSSEEQSSQDASSEEQSSEQQSSEESSSQDLEEVVAISVDDARTTLEENKDAVIDTENGQIAEYTATLTNLVKDQVVTFFYFGAEITEGIGSDMEDAEHKNLVQGTVGNFVVHNDADASNVTFKVYETGFSFWLTGYAEDAPVQDSYKMYVKDALGQIESHDMAQNVMKTTEYYIKDVELEASVEVFFCITLSGAEEWYHYTDVQSGCIGLVNDSPAYIHGDEEDARSDHNLVIKAAGTYDFYVDTAKDKDANQAIWVAKSASPEQLKTFYLVVNEKWSAQSEGVNPRFAVYSFGGALGEAWHDMTLVSEGVYSVQIDVANYTAIIFCRMKGSTAENNWSNKLNQTADLSIVDLTSDCYTLEAGADSGTWSTYSAE